MERRSVSCAAASERTPVASIVVTLVGCLLAGTVEAQDWGDAERPPSDGAREGSGVHEHDGFLLRAALGFGYEGLTIDDPLGNTTIGGAGAFIDIAIGGVIVDNLALNADIFGGMVVSPSVSVDGMDLGDAGDTTVSVDGLGVGLTYFIMPINIYLAGSAGIGVAGITIDGTDYESDAGFATNFMVGKEWWVGDDWGIGVAGQFMYSAIPRADIDATMPFLALNLMFSATYN